MKCEHCGSDQKCTLTSELGFCKQNYRGQLAPCVRDAKVERIARRMAVAAHEHKAAWAENFWHACKPDAEKFLAGLDVIAGT